MIRMVVRDFARQERHILPMDNMNLPIMGD